MNYYLLQEILSINNQDLSPSKECKFKLSGENVREKNAQNT